MLYQSLLLRSLTYNVRSQLCFISSYHIYCACYCTLWYVVYVTVVSNCCFYMITLVLKMLCVYVCVGLSLRLESACNSAVVQP